MALPVVKDFIAQVKEKAMGQEVIGSLTPDQAFIGVVSQALTDLMGKQNDALNLAAVPPAVILMAGLQGVGKPLLWVNWPISRKKISVKRYWWFLRTFIVRRRLSS